MMTSWNASSSGTELDISPCGIPWANRPATPTMIRAKANNVTTRFTAGLLRYGHEKVGCGLQAPGCRYQTAVGPGCSTITHGLGRPETWRLQRETLKLGDVRRLDGVRRGGVFYRFSLSRSSGLSLPTSSLNPRIAWPSPRPSPASRP